MSVSTSLHFQNKFLVSSIKRRKFPHPSLSLWMMRIAPLPLVPGQNIPEAVELAMFAEQVLSTELLWRQVPDSHCGSIYLHPDDQHQVGGSRLSCAETCSDDNHVAFLCVLLLLKEVRNKGKSFV